MSRARVAGVVILGALVVAAVAVLVVRGLRPAVELGTPYQAVLLANGQAYFGRIQEVGTQYPVLREVYYVQTRVDPQTKATSNVLVRRGKEWHGPDRMILNRDHILFIEPVATDSAVAKLIEELKKQ